MENFGQSVDMTDWGPTIPVVMTCADRRPFQPSVSVNFPYSQPLQGPALSDWISIPTTRPTLALRMKCGFLLASPPLSWQRQLQLCTGFLEDSAARSFNGSRASMVTMHALALKCLRTMNPQVRAQERVTLRRVIRRKSNAEEEQAPLLILKLSWSRYSLSYQIL